MSESGVETTIEVGSHSLLVPDYLAISQNFPSCFNVIVCMRAG